MRRLEIITPPKLGNQMLRNRSASTKRHNHYPDDGESACKDIESSVESSERRAKVKFPCHIKNERNTARSNALVFSKCHRVASVPKLPRETQRRFKNPESTISRWSNASAIRPLFGGESDSVAISSNGTKVKNNFVVKSHDDPWQAARRGDLTALKAFQCRGRTDWMKNDEIENIPLYYACNTGAITDILTVPFLLWATKTRDKRILEKCYSDAANRKVKAILTAYIEGGLPVFGQIDKKPPVGSSGCSHQSEVSCGESGKWIHEQKDVEEMPLRCYQTKKEKTTVAEAVASLDGTLKRGSPNCVTDAASTRSSFSCSVKSAIFRERGNENIGPSSKDQERRQNETSAAEEYPVERREDVPHPIEISITSSPTSDGLEMNLAATEPVLKEKETQEAFQYPATDSKTPKDFKCECVRESSHETQCCSQEGSSDKPIETNRNGWRDAVGRSPSLSDRDDDLWSLGSMLSLKTWRSIKKNGIGGKWDNIVDRAFPDKVIAPRTKAIPRTEAPLNARIFPKPYIEYYEKEKMWMVGNQWKQAKRERDKMVHVHDVKQRVHIINCHGVNIHIHGRKMKALQIDNCSDVNVIFDSIITTCEVFNCSNMGIQVTGICPTFSFEDTVGVTIWLTCDGMKASNFLTNKSSDITISIPQEDDFHPWERKEIPLPIQYAHRFENDGIKSYIPGKL